MLLASAAWDARVPRRITAAAIAAALQGVFCWLILHEAIAPTPLRSLTPLQVTIFQAARRSRPVMGRQRPQPGPPHRLTPKREAASPPAAQPITLPPAGRPGPGASIDWQQALRREVRARELSPSPGKLEFGLPRRPAAGPTVPRFGWDYARTHRVEPLPEGGLLINLSDRCAVVLYVLPIPVCRIGRIPPDGGLFDHMRDRRSDGPDALP
jgi:hypothetical protein